MKSVARKPTQALNVLCIVLVFVRAMSYGGVDAAAVGV